MHIHEILYFALGRTWNLKSHNSTLFGLAVSPSRHLCRGIRVIRARAISSRFDPTLSPSIGVYSGSVNPARQGTCDSPSERSPLKIVFTETKMNEQNRKVPEEKE